MGASLPIIQPSQPPPLVRRPEWLKVRLPGGDKYTELKALVRRQGLHTVCESARCPNVAECWGHGTATFMILGNLCTRACGFCAVPHGKPLGLDTDEPRRVAEAVRTMGLDYAVVTSVNRDDLEDGGAAIFAETIRALRRAVPGCKVEVLIPDFRGNWAALKTVIEARPEVLNHNTETVPRLYRRVRMGAVYGRSLELLRRAKQLAPHLPTKSGLMLGLGETYEEILQTLGDLRAQQVDIVTVGQYLQPTRNHLPVVRFYHPEEFARLKRDGEALGLRHVEAGPLVRSSYHAHDQQTAAAGNLET
ncbi:lipoyl synthase [Acidobacteriia bacterium AH_259_A11_L15]|nr:lipoyl synthase [Acidobacteriia bacterium AH_259_A11_L15]